LTAFRIRRGLILLKRLVSIRPGVNLGTTLIVAMSIGLASVLVGDSIGVQAGVFASPISPVNTPTHTPTTAPAATTTPTAEPAATSTRTVTPVATSTPTVTPATVAGGGGDSGGGGGGGDNGGGGGGGGGGGDASVPIAQPNPTQPPVEFRVAAALPSMPSASAPPALGPNAVIPTGDASIAITLPMGTTRSVVTTFQQVTSGSAAPPQGTLQLGSKLFLLEFRDPTTNVKVPTWTQLTITYTDADVAGAGGDPNRLSVGVFDGTNWVPLPGTMNAANHTITISTLVDATFGILVAQPPAAELDHEIPNGRFYSQANGFGGGGRVGYSVTDADGIPFWRQFQQLGGVDVVGYPVTRRFMWDGFITQVFQKLVLQWHPDTHTVAFVNVFDDLSRLGFDNWLAVQRQTPPSFDTSLDSGLPFDQVQNRHLAILDTSPEIRDYYLQTPDWLNRYGLPVSAADYGNVFVVRAQRAVFQQWKTDMPWATAKQVLTANGGDTAKEAGIWPLEANAPEPAPAR
jgi:hypothetical protein